ncbi:hypothetical protein L3Q65_17265 [Amycolatopsis sp. FU40]|uniref:hypothetical protein n=1 Tax=Amycolatopsis sp. FU40 TaxID=2914159 RepID=UPI001F3DB6E6|nr:hypothetical protein [Amycolatopsis sp. FU40]UKD58401.1 hypothetical protein L3Q65_17265 [Amycolatopsis sp. FU40]
MSALERGRARAAAGPLAGAGRRRVLGAVKFVRRGAAPSRETPAPEWESVLAAAPRSVENIPADRAECRAAARSAS